MMEVELACVGDVRHEQGDRVCIHQFAEINDERCVPRAGQAFGNPLLVPVPGRDVRPKR